MTMIIEYSRAEAIDDGVLVDIPVNKLAQEYGFTAHTAMTVGLLHEIKPDERQEEEELQDLNGRIWDMLTMFRAAIRGGSNGQDTLKFTFLLSSDRSGKKDVELEVKAVIGPGDNSEPVITLMLPHED